MVVSVIDSATDMLGDVIIETMVELMATSLLLLLLSLLLLLLLLFFPPALSDTMLSLLQILPKFGLTTVLLHINSSPATSWIDSR